MQKLPWLYYSGETASELIACKNSHRIDSLLCAFEEGIQNKGDRQGVITGVITEDERLVLAVMALQREVNNGGHWQFFVNSSRQYAPMIRESLARIGCTLTLAIVSDAIAALGISALTPEIVSAAIRTEDPVRDRILDDCDQRFYRLDEITGSLFSFVEEHQNEIQLMKPLVPPRRPQPPKYPHLPKLYAGLLLSKEKDYRLDSVRRLVRTIAADTGIAPSEAELECAAVNHAFRLAVKAEDFAACRTLAQQASEVLPDETHREINPKQWAEKLIAAG